MARRGQKYRLSLEIVDTKPVRDGPKSLAFHVYRVDSKTTAVDLIFLLEPNFPRAACEAIKDRNEMSKTRKLVLMLTLGGALCISYYFISKFQYLYELCPRCHMNKNFISIRYKMNKLL